MSAQALIADALVLAAAVYAVWALMPSIWRRPLAQHLAQRLGLPEPANGAGTCATGCGGCGTGPSARRPEPAQLAVITVHRQGRPPR